MEVEIRTCEGQVGESRIVVGRGTDVSCSEQQQVDEMAYLYRHVYEAVPVIFLRCVVTLLCCERVRWIEDL